MNPHSQVSISKSKTLQLLMFPIFLFLSGVPAWGSQSQIRTFKDLNRRKQQEKEALERGKQFFAEANAILDNLMGPSFMNEKKEREQKVNQKVQQEIEKDPVIQALEKDKKEVLPQLYANLHDPHSSALKASQDLLKVADEVISDRKKQIQEKVEKSIPKVRPGGVLGELTESLSEGSKLGGLAWLLSLEESGAAA